MLARLSVPNDPRLLEAALSSIVETSRLEIRRGSIPPLYKSGVVYRPEPAGQENWQSASETLRLGYGDCEDLVAWRVAELLEGGTDARARVLAIRPGLWHVVVEYGDGWREDPSAVLGMYNFQRRNERTKKMSGIDLPDAERLEPDMAQQLGDAALEARAVEVADAIDDHAAAKAEAPAPAVEPVTPSVRWKTRQRKDGTHDAVVAVRLVDGSIDRHTVHARTRKAAMVRAAQRAREMLNDPLVAALVPAQAAIAIKALGTLAVAARDGRLAHVARNLTMRGLRRLARAFA